MLSRFAAIAIASGAALGAPALATSIADPTGDFLSTYAGAEDPDLDVTSFGVLYDPGLALFTLSATFAGPIDTSLPGFYVIGANTGTGPSSFAGIGRPGVRFNQVIIIQKTGAATIGGTPLAAGSVTIFGGSLAALVPLARLPSTGFGPEFYGFNIWPRSAAAGITGTAAISDFAPDNATIAAVPEPRVWAMMLLGFGAIGIALRHGRPRAFRDRSTKRRPGIA